MDIRIRSKGIVMLRISLSMLSALFLLAISPAAWAAPGLVGQYYSGFKVVDQTIVFDGLTLVKTETNTVFDYWNGSQYYDWNPIGNMSYSLRWTGFLQVTNAGLHGFGIISDDGSQLWINGQLVVNNYEQQWYDWQEGWWYLAAGYHAIEIAFYEAASYSGIEVWWLPPSAGPSPLPYTGDNFHSTPPTYNAATLWTPLGGDAVHTTAPYVNPILTAQYVPDISAVELTWPGSTNVNYTIQLSTNLVSWQDIAGPLPGVSGLMTQAVSAPYPQAFFRARLEPVSP